jgi:hypothetical protein
MWVVADRSTELDAGLSEKDGPVDQGLDRSDEGGRIEGEPWKQEKASRSGRSTSSGRMRKEAQRGTGTRQIGGGGPASCAPKEADPACLWWIDWTDWNGFELLLPAFGRGDEYS